MSKTAESVLRLSPRIELFPILHGSGDVAQEVRERMITRRVDCLAVPLPPSFEPHVEPAIAHLPSISMIVAREPDTTSVNFVPIDPCQPVIMGIRVAMGEGIPRAYIDREVQTFEPTPFVAPDPYALKRVSLAAFASALIPSLTPPVGEQQLARIRWMAFRLHELELDYSSILCLCPVADWPWIRQAYRERQPYRDPESASPVTAYTVDPSTLYFVLGELPFITERYERRRVELRSDRHVTIDGIKELLLETRSQWMAREDQMGAARHWITPQLLIQYLQYVRNLALVQRRLTPDLYSLVIAAKQMAGDEFAILLLETAKTYTFQQAVEAPRFAPTIAAGVGKLELPDGDVVRAKNRLQGPPLVWRSLSLRPKPTPMKSRRWALQWNPYRQCSWPPEDHRIESFTRHVRDHAKALLGADLARVEKFTTSVKDGIDLRESLRHWHRIPPRSARSTGGQNRTAAAPRAKPEIYVKEIPPARGTVDTVVFLFETPADPMIYSWQATWYAEHEEESTLCFYATPFHGNVIAPGIAESRYGGASFLFPPRPIRNIWDDPALSFARTLEERLIAGAALYSRERHIVVVTPVPPRAAWRRLVRDCDRRLIPIPLTRFSGQTIDRIRRFHVLNGHEIRSYAAQFIRE